MPSKLSLSVLGLSTLLPYALANGDYLFTIYRDAGCQKADGDENSFLELHTFDSSDSGCQQGDVIPTDDWERNQAGQYKGYVNAAGLDKECKIAVLKQADVQPDTCGLPIIVIDGAQSHNCVQLWLDEYIGTYYCCNDECDRLGLGNNLISSNNNKRRRSHARELPPAASSLWDMPVVSGETPKPAAAAKADATSNSRAIKRDDSCKWEGQGKKKTRALEGQKLTGDQPCELSDGCDLSNAMQVSWQATSTFGISSEVGASFFEVVSVSMSLSYEYSYSEGASSTVTYSVTQPQGTTGHIEWFQYYWCDTGKFTGNCDSQGFGDLVGSEGENCIPVELANGNPDGAAVFVASI
ncbi:hypothetical protein PGQ11_007006 [Apiospora arundinis]|uniref:Uncharacterized protein n=1 Tax=Apiospora arundinis TaxID=335852 RepID=A0ABR2IUQ8_9PEZI